MRPEGGKDASQAGARLVGQGRESFLAPHHLAAAARFEALVRRAQLSPRLTMSYDPAHVGGRQRGAGEAAHMGDGAAEARLVLSRIAGKLPAECWGVLFDVCGLGKGLQQVEAERRWPRRSAKLVLRISLDQLAAQFGLREQAAGANSAPVQGWREQRLPLIAEKP